MNARRSAKGTILALGVALLIVMSTSVSVAQRNEPRASSPHRFIELKLRDDAQPRVDGGNVVSRVGRDLSAVQGRLASPEVVNATPLLGDLVDEADDAFARQVHANHDAGNPASYLRVEVADDADVDRIAEELRSLPGVEDAYPAPQPAPPPASPNFVNQQSQLAAAPDGLGIAAASALNGGTGKGLRVADLEYSWNTQHEDVPAARAAGAMIRVGTPSDPFENTDHGTAAIGVLSAKKNTFGVQGESFASKLYMVNTYSLEYDVNIPAAIVAAMTKLRAGDVLLIEQQAWGPGGELLPVEWVASTYDAIALATASGILVVEAAGNGGVDLDSATYGSPFPEGKANSGAILVGAGSNCSGNAKRQRLSFSNYGSRVDVQGHGECVVTSGYGDLFSNGPNATYTGGFSGTSSASATIAGAAGVVSAGHKAALGFVASPAVVRVLLIWFSTPQDNAVGGKIGPLPDAYRALVAVDSIAPGAATNVTISLTAGGDPLIKWKAAVDNQAVKSYQVFRNGSLLTTLDKKLSYTDKSTSSATTYSYYVRAVDHAGNVGQPSATVTISTP